MEHVPNLVLASTSPYRRELLARLGLPFRTRAPMCDEEGLKAAGLAPTELAATWRASRPRACGASSPPPSSCGSDQVVAIDDRGMGQSPALPGGAPSWTRVLGKPGSVERAAEQLERARRAHPRAGHGGGGAPRGPPPGHVDVTRLSMRPLSRAQIERYVRPTRPLDCAGRYRIEARGIALFDRIESADHTAIVGLPLMALTSMLASLGYPVP